MKTILKSDYVYCIKDYFQNDAHFTHIWKLGNWYRRQFIEETWWSGRTTRDWVFDTERSDIKLSFGIRNDGEDKIEQAMNFFYTKSQMRKLKLEQLERKNCRPSIY